MSLSHYFRAVADWRREHAEDCLDGEPDLQSAAALDSLADYVDDGAQWPALAELDPHLDGGALGGEMTWRTVARYGYGYEATTPYQHEELLEELAVCVVADAYEFARRHDGDDPTDTLLPAELDAARDGVILPRRYFERRSHATESELERAIDEHHVAP